MRNACYEQAHSRRFGDPFVASLHQVFLSSRSMPLAVTTMPSFVAPVVVAVMVVLIIVAVFRVIVVSD